MEAIVDKAIALTIKAVKELQLKESESSTSNAMYRTRIYELHLAYLMDNKGDDNAKETE